jgi:hypothetical protein
MLKIFFSFGGVLNAGAGRGRQKNLPIGNIFRLKINLVSDWRFDDLKLPARMYCKGMHQNLLGLSALLLMKTVSRPEKKSRAQFF